MAQQVAHDWTTQITKRKNAQGQTVYTILANGTCSDPNSSIQVEIEVKNITADIAFSPSMTLVQLAAAIEAGLLKAATGQ